MKSEKQEKIAEPVVKKTAPMESLINPASIASLFQQTGACRTCVCGTLAGEGS